jgi:phosphoserine aminotransferase
MATKDIFFTPGPGQLHPLVPEFMREALAANIPSISHRSSQFEKIYEDAAKCVRASVGAPDTFQVFFLGSATEAMERIVQNCCAKNSFHFVNGAFAERFFQTAHELDRNAKEAKAAYGQGFDFDKVDIPKDIELICVTQNETSTGVMQSAESIKKLKQKHPKKLLAVDFVSSAPYPELSFDHVDAAFFSVQKCYGLPAGLGVLLVNDFCMEKSADILRLGQSIGTYHNFPTLFSYAEKNQTPETPNVLGIYLLGRVAKALVEYGMDKIRAEIDVRAKALYDFVDSGGKFSAFVKEKGFRSPTVVTAVTSGPAAPILKKLSAAGLHLGSGYGKLKDNQIRIANFPAHSIAEIEQVIEALKTA